jgi:hypothetical protein
MAGKMKSGRPKRTAKLGAARSLAIYDGHDCIGTIEESTDGQALAFDVAGKRLGSFSSLKAASAAFSTASDPEPRR